jgi:hypothetical protein
MEDRHVRNVPVTMCVSLEFYTLGLQVTVKVIDCSWLRPEPCNRTVMLRVTVPGGSVGDRTGEALWLIQICRIAPLLQAHTSVLAAVQLLLLLTQLHGTDPPPHLPNLSALAIWCPQSRSCIALLPTLLLR